MLYLIKIWLTFGDLMSSPEKYFFYNPELSREKTLAQKNELQLAADFLSFIESQDELIDSGNVTFAMIRPSVGPEANLLSLPDSEAADSIEEMITGLGVMAKFSFIFTKEAVEELYDGDPRENMENQIPLDLATYATRWPEFVDFMTSAPTTALILHNPDGNAIEKWREHLGHWNVDVNRDELTIRGRLAVNKYNNLVHGSDSPEAVRREIGIIKGVLTT